MQCLAGPGREYWVSQSYVTRFRAPENDNTSNKDQPTHPLSLLSTVGPSFHRCRVLLLPLHHYLCLTSAGLSLSGSPASRNWLSCRGSLQICLKPPVDMVGFSAGRLSHLNLLCLRSMPKTAPLTLSSACENSCAVRYNLALNSVTTEYVDLARV